jgi:hypothetical protein
MLASVYQRTQGLHEDVKAKIEEKQLDLQLVIKEQEPQRRIRHGDSRDANQHTNNGDPWTRGQNSVKSKEARAEQRHIDVGRVWRVGPSSAASSSILFVAIAFQNHFRICH